MRMYVYVCIYTYIDKHLEHRTMFRRNHLSNATCLTHDVFDDVRTVIM